MLQGKTTSRQLLAALVLGAAMLVGSGNALASEPPIAVGEIAPGAGVDTADVRATAEGEIRQLDAAQLRGRGNLVVALALVKTQADNAVKYTVNAMVRDAKTGAMLAIIEGGAHAEGQLSAALAKQVAHAAVRGVISRIPTALLAKR